MTPLHPANGLVELFTFPEIVQFAFAFVAYEMHTRAIKNVLSRIRFCNGAENIFIVLVLKAGAGCS